MSDPNFRFVWVLFLSLSRVWSLLVCGCWALAHGKRPPATLIINTDFGRYIPETETALSVGTTQQHSTFICSPSELLLSSTRIFCVTRWLLARNPSANTRFLPTLYPLVPVSRSLSSERLQTHNLLLHAQNFPETLRLQPWSSPWACGTHQPFLKNAAAVRINVEEFRIELPPRQRSGALRFV